MIAHASPTRPTTRVRDVVCAMPIHLVEEALLHREHWHGRAFFFCSTVCRDEFRRAPERYVPGSISATTGISDTPDARLIWLPLLGATDADGERIESALRSLAGVEGVHANAGCGLVTVLYDPTAVTADVFIETLQVVACRRRSSASAFGSAACTAPRAL